MGVTSTSWKVGEPQPWQVERMKAQWADPEWKAEQQRKIAGGRKTGKPGGSRGKTWKTGKPAWNRKEQVVRECLASECTTVISTPPSLARIRFCSNRCQARTTNRRGFNNTRYDADPYSGDWVELREKVLKRDEHRCWLGCTRPGKRLEVHHLCYDASCRDENHVVTLCSRCHQGGHRRGLWSVELGRVA